MLPRRRACARNRRCARGADVSANCFAHRHVQERHAAAEADGHIDSALRTSTSAPVVLPLLATTQSRMLSTVRAASGSDRAGSCCLPCTTSRDRCFRHSPCRQQWGGRRARQTAKGRWSACFGLCIRSVRPRASTINVMSPLLIAALICCWRLTLAADAVISAAERVDRAQSVGVGLQCRRVGARHLLEAAGRVAAVEVRGVAVVALLAGFCRCRCRKPRRVVSRRDQPPVCRVSCCWWCCRNRWRREHPMREGNFAHANAPVFESAGLVPQGGAYFNAGSINTEAPEN